MKTLGRVCRIVATGIGLVAIVVLAVVVLNAPEPPSNDVSIITARRIITMDPARPSASAVAVRAGRIVAVGSADALEGMLRDEGVTYDVRVEDRFLVPGFIDPHLHPSLAATILPMEIVSAMEWVTPAGRTKPVRGREAFLARLREIDRALPPGEWLKAWGYHAPYHGTLAKADLDAVSTTRPIVVWQRSVHEMYFNGRALEELGLGEADFAEHDQADWETGHIWEAALFTLGRPMVRILAAPSTYRRGLSMMSEVIHRGGLTTVAEQGFPQTGLLAELAMLHLELRLNDRPYRFVLVPNAMFLAREHGSAEEAERAAARMLRWSTDRIRILDHMNYYADGAIYSQLMQMTEPYLDGHHGEWLMPPEDQAAVLEAFWKRGWHPHVHVNGDAGLDLVLDQLEARMKADPDPERRVVMEHYGYARDDQHARLAALGIDVSNNAYYVHELAPIYAEHGLGPERAADISPLGGLERAGVGVSFHSDFLMAPAEPLLHVWVAVNRIASDGQVWGGDQTLSLDAALRAVTIEAARHIGMEGEIGSIAPGKRADFTVLDRDPYAVRPRDIKDIGVLGTYFEGRLHWISPAQESAE